MSLVGVHALAGLHLLHWKLAGWTLAPVEPSEAFDTIHLGVITVGFLFLAGAVLATALAGRFFCSWGCHILALQDLSGWLLARVGVRPRPIRSRVLVWVPPIAALYLFVWPQVERVWRGDPLPELRVVTDVDGWTSFTTNDLLRSFPGLPMTLTTFAVCGAVIVYFLGSRSFCWYACPYGAIFAAAERFAPLRIVAGAGACSNCGVCTANCKSNVRVIEEVRLHGSVVDANCFKDLDCVSACPTGAIQLGLATPTVLRLGSEQAKPSKPYDYTRGEDALIAVVFVGSLLVLRGLYDLISFLLALALAALVAFLSVAALRLAREGNAKLGRWRLRESGAVTTTGRAFTAIALLTGGLMTHSAYIQWRVRAGQRAAEQVVNSEAVDADQLAAALDHLGAASRHGLTTPPGLRWRLASLHLRAGSPGAARRELNALVATDPGDLPARVRLAEAWLLDGRPELATQQAKQAVAMAAETDTLSRAERYAIAAAHRLLGDRSVSTGDRADAVASFQRAVRLNPQDFESQLALGAVLVAAGRGDEAVEHFEICVVLQPGSAAAHNNLATILAQRGEKLRAVKHCRLALRGAPEDPLAQCRVGLLLLDLGEPEAAREALSRALELQPGLEEAERGLKRLLAAP